MTRSEVIEILDGTHARVGRGVALGIYALICISAVVIALETLPDLTPRMNAILVGAEVAILTLFVIEYVLRLTCTEKPWKYAFSFWGIVDFLAIVPALVFLLPDFATIRAIRLLRILRLLKLFKANRALDRIAKALNRAKTEFAIFFFIACVALYLAAVGIYHFEHEAQPDGFSSIPESLWWAIATFTTVGYGDVYPITAGGRIFTGLVMLIGIGIIAVPAGLVTAALTEATPTAPDEENVPPKTASPVQVDMRAATAPAASDKEPPESNRGDDS